MLVISIGVEKVHANDTKVDKNSIKGENENKNTTKCYNSDGWETLNTNHDNHTTTDCKDGKCYGAWLTGE